MRGIYLKFTAGSGPRECSLVVMRAAKECVTEATDLGLKAVILCPENTEMQETKSLLVKITGKETDNFIASWIGTIKWIGQSRFRPHHKRKNWYIAVHKVVSPDDIQELHDSDIKYQTMRASGPGGQHVNCTDSAVRAIHIPSGTSVVAMEERSQHANKKTARLKLANLFQEKIENEKNAQQQLSWQQNHQLERGNEIRIYQGAKFKRKS